MIRSQQKLPDQIRCGVEGWGQIEEVKVVAVEEGNNTIMDRRKRKNMVAKTASIEEGDGGGNNIAPQQKATTNWQGWLKELMMEMVMMRMLANIAVRR